MSAQTVTTETPTSTTIAAEAIDEKVWQTWVAKGRAQERADSAACSKGAKRVSVVALLVAAGLWSQFAPFALIIRFIVAASATFIMFQALHAKRYPVAAEFGALALLYNPVVPVFGFSGDWQRALVVASAIPFVASLTSRSRKHRSK